MRKFLVKIKNKYSFFYFLWSYYQKQKGVFYLKKYTDKEAIVKLYKDFSGKIPDLKTPKTFSEKMQWLKLNYKNPLMTICADKWLVRDYLKTKGYEDLLCNVIMVIDKLDDFNLDLLPNQFAAKATHGSGWNLICESKKNINWFWWKKIMYIWLSNNIFWPGRELLYKNMKPRIIFEEYMNDFSGGLIDYKFFCFHGDIKFIQANKGRDTDNHAQNFYDLEWNILPFGKDLKPRPDIIITAPKNFHKMIEIASDLSKEFPFVRIDFYEVKNNVIFGEMTFFPKSGLPDFTVLDYDKILGDEIKLDKIHND